MNHIDQIFQRIRTANEESQIAVELIEGQNKKEVRAYFANCLPAPSHLIAKNIEVEKIRGSETKKPTRNKNKTQNSVDNKTLMMPFRNPKNQLGNFYGSEGMTRLRKILDGIGFCGGAA